MPTTKINKQKFINQAGLVNFIVILSFFPFIAFIPILQAEVQPYCYLFTIFYAIIYKQKFPFLFYIFLFIIISYFIIYIFFNNYHFFDFVTIPHLLIFVGPPMFLYIIYKNFHLIKLNYIHTIFYIWTIFGIVQNFLPLILEVSGIEKFLGIFIQRFSARALSASGDRGVTSLSNEPSYAAIIFFATYFVILFQFLKKQITKRKFLIATVFFSINLIINASLTIFILIFILALAIIHQTRTYLISLAAIILIFSPLFFFKLDFRIIKILSSLPQMLDIVDWNIMDFFTISLGSIREFSVFIAIKSVFIHPFGNGYYSSLTKFISVAKEEGYDLTRVMFFTWQGNGYVNMKPYGYGALILFEFGIVPFLLIMSIPIRIFNLVTKNCGQYKRFGQFTFWFILVLINFNTVASLPSYWFCLIISLKVIELKYIPLSNDN